jgi:hypothetical protein
MPTAPPSDMNVRLPRDLVERIRVIAQAEERSLSAQLRVALNDYAKQRLPEARRKLKEREGDS